MKTPENCPDCTPADDHSRPLIHRERTRREFSDRGRTRRENSGRGRTRREFLGAAALAAAGTALPSFAGAAEKTGTKAAQGSNSETLVKTLYESLSEEQMTKICFSFDDPLRLKVDNNWHITKTSLNDFNADQQAMIKDIFMGLHSPEYADKVYNQVVHDSGKKGFEDSSIALFGEPGTGKFEFVLTGRHCTRRCDGDSVAGSAFGGPLFYGHAADTFNEGPDHMGNAYWYQALRANEVYAMLDEAQRKEALQPFGRKEQGTDTVKLTGKKKGLEGIQVADLSSDQKDHVRKVIQDVLAPYRSEDVAESMKYIDKNGFDNLHLAFFENGDIGEDKVWDVWQIEGPAAIMYFRGSPHVHAWIHIRESAFESKDPFAA